MDELNIKAQGVRSRRSPACPAGTSRRPPWPGSSTRRPDVLLLDEPTRGIDVLSKAQIYEWMGRPGRRGQGPPFRQLLFSRSSWACATGSPSFSGGQVVDAPPGRRNGTTRASWPRPRRGKRDTDAIQKPSCRIRDQSPGAVPRADPGDRPVLRRCPTSRPRFLRLANLKSRGHPVRDRGPGRAGHDPHHRQRRHRPVGRVQHRPVQRHRRLRRQRRPAAAPGRRPWVS